MPLLMSQYSLVVETSLSPLWKWCFPYCPTRRHCVGNVESVESTLGKWCIVWNGMLLKWSPLLFSSNSSYWFLEQISLQSGSWPIHPPVTSLLVARKTGTPASSIIFPLCISFICLFIKQKNYQTTHLPHRGVFKWGCQLFDPRQLEVTLTIISLTYHMELKVLLLCNLCGRVLPFHLLLLPE